MIDLPDAVDYVIVGGGLAGCVVAARLSENPAVSVLLLEAGRENLYEHSYYAAGAHSMWVGDTNWHFRSTPQRELGGRIIDHPRGRLVGGSAAINVGSWSRGVADDYDEWVNLGADGWGWSTALDWFRQIEASRRPQDGTRGANGPMILEDTPIGSDMTELFREACDIVGIGETPDHNGTRFEGFDRWESIFPAGRRYNSAEAYLAPARSRSNLIIATAVFVTRVAIENSRAVGVEYEVDGTAKRVTAQQEVVLCAGAFQSPQLLLLSGIGPAEHLQHHGIAVVCDVPGVGTNLIDHMNVAIGGAAAGPTAIKPVDSDPTDPNQLETWRHSGGGPLAVSVSKNPAIAFVRSTPDVQADIELLFAINPPDELRDQPDAGGFSITIANVHPSSRGLLRLASPDPHSAPNIDFGYLSHPDDLPVMISGVRQAMAIAATNPLAPYAARLTYDPHASDADIETLIRSTGGTMYHPVGTARMGRDDDPMAVLDSQLRVRGVNGLRVIDASSMPNTVRGHTMAPVVYLAERGSEIIRHQQL